MNPINMRHLLMKASTVAIMIFGLVSAAKADRIGNGDGDGAFALARLAQENPGLSDREILLKAFRESYGRMPEFCGPRTGVKVWEGTRHWLLGGTEVLGYVIDVGNEGRSVDLGVGVTEDAINRGPLLPKRNAKIQYVIWSEDWRIWSKKNKSADLGRERSGLNLRISVRDFAEGYFQPEFIEFRQYSKNSVVFIVGPGQKSDDDPTPVCFRARFKYDLPIDGICDVGYLWVEPSKTNPNGCGK